MANTMDNVTVKVTVEVTQKRANSWGEEDTIARSIIQDTSSTTIDEIAEKIDNVAGDAISRAQLQLSNTKRIKAIEQQNKLLAEKGA